MFGWFTMRCQIRPDAVQGRHLRFQFATSGRVILVTGTAGFVGFPTQELDGRQQGASQAVSRGEMFLGSSGGGLKQMEDNDVMQFLVAPSHPVP